MPKQIRVRWTELTTYESAITVPDDYPEDVDGCDALPTSGSGEHDWWEQVESQNPEWPTNGFVEVSERELEEVEVLAEKV